MSPGHRSSYICQFLIGWLQTTFHRNPGVPFARPFSAPQSVHEAVNQPPGQLLSPGWQTVGSAHQSHSCEDLVVYLGGIDLRSSCHACSSLSLHSARERERERGMTKWAGWKSIKLNEVTAVQWQYCFCTINSTSAMITCSK